VPTNISILKKSFKKGQALLPDKTVRPNFKINFAQKGLQTRIHYSEDSIIMFVQIHHPVVTKRNSLRYGSIGFAAIGIFFFVQGAL